MQGVDWKKFILVVAALWLMGTITNNYYASRDRIAAQPHPIAQIVAPELRVISSSQSADGVTEKDLTPQLADAMGKYGVERLTAKMGAMAKQAGVTATPKISSEPTVIQTQGKKLVVIRYLFNDSARGIEIIGISGLNLDRVMCTRESLDEILIASGACAQKIQEIYGVKIGS